MGSLISSLAFAAPLALLALALAPAVWWLLRALPPPPRNAAFPSLHILRHIDVEEATPAKPPLPLLGVRMALFFAVVLAIAGPRLDPGVLPPGATPVVVIVDNGWASAPHFDKKREALDDIIDAAASDNRKLAVIATAPDADGEPIILEGRAAELRDALLKLQPQPWPVNYKAVLKRAQNARFNETHYAIWLSDGITAPDALDLATEFRDWLTIWSPDSSETPLLLRPPVRDGARMDIAIERGDRDSRPQVSLIARSTDGAAIARASTSFENGAQTTSARLIAPVETLNRIARLEIANQASAGATILLDSAWGRSNVGIVRLAESGGHPLLDPSRYLLEALKPFAEVHTGTVDALIKAEIDVILLTDQAGADPDIRQTLDEWTRDGGVLIRFAGPRLTETPDGLTPVPLRAGGRALGGSMSWSTPLGLAPLPEQGPLNGLTPPDGVAVSRQALAEPGPELAAVTWAALADGTPLVTGGEFGDGILALIHVDAGPDWSDLPISGFFVEMLRRLTALATERGQAKRGNELAAMRIMDGYGRMAAAPPGLSKLKLGPDAVTPGPRLPPGYYGPEDAPMALNLSPAIDTLGPLPQLPRAKVVSYGGADVIRIAPWLLGLAALLLLGEFLLTLGYSGRLPALPGMSKRNATTAGMLALFLLLVPGDLEAQGISSAAALETRLAFIETGNPEIDRQSRMGLIGVAKALNDRTSVEPGPPLGINLDRDDVTLLPFIYWPVTSDFPVLSMKARAKLARYISTGGMILFDTRDGDRAAALEPLGQATPEAIALRRILEGAPVPPLTPIPLDHVLTRSYYLLNEFPGRIPSSPIWVERAGSSAYDGVTAIIIGGSSWAAAWAIDDAGRPIYSVSPGGDRQRELATRFGVNVVMHALTGSYKGDQVHLPSIMQRLGQ
jgi:hypothetical protein